MKTLISFFIAILGTCSTWGQESFVYSQSEFSIKNKLLIMVLDTNQNIKLKVKESSDEFIHIEATVRVLACKKGIVDYLKKTGRYHLKMYENDQFYASVLSLKYKMLDVTINGIKIQETIIYTIYIPKGLRHKITVPTKREEENEEISAIR